MKYGIQIRRHYTGKQNVSAPYLRKTNTMYTNNNYRGITLVDSCYKVLSLALLRRLEVYSRDIIGDYKSAGFLSGKCTPDHISQSDKY